MSLNKNTKRKYTKKILYWQDNIDWNKFTKPNDYGDYYFIRNDGNHLLFENRVFLDKEGNGAIYQAHRYLNQAYYHRTAIVNKNKPIWSNWVLLNTYNDIMHRDNRINDIENRFNWLNGGDGFPKYINHLNWVRNARCDPDMANQINYVWARANDTWNRTEDLYNWCLDDIRLDNYELRYIGNANGPTRVGGGLNKNGKIIHDDRITEEPHKIITGIINDAGGPLFDRDHGTRRTLSYKGRRRGWQIAVFA